MLEVLTNATKKQKAAFITVIVVGIGFNAYIHFTKPKKNANAVPSTPVVATPSVANAQTPPKPEKLDAYSLIETPSPFQPLPNTNNGQVAQAGTSYGSKSFKSPPIPDPKEFRNGINGNAGTGYTPKAQGNQLYVKNIAWSSRIGASGVAVISNGQDDFAVTEGDSTKWGRVTSVTKTSVTVGEKVLSLEQASNEFSVPYATAVPFAEPPITMGGQ